VPLHDPFVYSDCILCPRGYYRERDLRSHYFKDHMLEFGTAALPTSLLALRDFETDRASPAWPAQVSATRCSLCGLSLETADAVRLHKTTHVNPKFMKYKCDECGGNYLLTEVAQTCAYHVRPT